MRFLERLRSDTRGNVLAIGAAGTLGLIGAAGLAVDASNWYLWKRQLQQAVDSGALAGAYALSQGRPVVPAATADLDKNANSEISVEQMVSPPTSGAYAGDTGAVEIMATTSRALPFSSLFMVAPPIIRARSVATAVAEGEHCIISLARDGVGVNVAGTANIQLGCGVAANSGGSQAIFMEGSSWLDGSPLSAVGGIDGGTSNFPNSTDIHAYGPPQTDPIASRNLQVPIEPALCKAMAFEAPPNKVTTISPGRFCDGIAIKGEAVMEAGVYLVDRGSFYVSSKASLTGHGVTIILTGDGPSNIAVTDIAGGANLDLRPPTATEDPTWKGILFFQDPQGSSNLSTLAGSSTSNLQGVIYMPKGTVRFAGNAGQHSDCLLLVSHRVLLTGTTSLENTCPVDYEVNDFSGRRIRVVE